MDDNFLNKVNNAYQKGLKDFEKPVDYINTKAIQFSSNKKNKSKEKDLELV